MPFLKTFFIPILLILCILDFTSFHILARISKGLNISVFIITLIFCLEYYCWQSFRVLTNSKTLALIYIVGSIVIYSILIYYQITAQKNFVAPQYKKIFIIIALFLAPKLAIALGLFIEDCFRMIAYFFVNKNTEYISVPGRRKAISLIATSIASIIFLGIFDGVTNGRYRFRVIRKKIKIKDLPQEFEGFTITQISDIHSGSFDNVEKVKKGVEMIAEQNSDILVFTGDMVNNHYSEMLPYKTIFSRLRAKDGMYCVLGNHDYGIYGNLTTEEQHASIQKLQQMQREMGFTVLNNEMHTIERNGKKLNIIGVENWGNSIHFPKKGDLRKASEQAQEGDINILLSHDPSHFDHHLEGYDNVVDFHKIMHLTLSGHTHGMQFGIEIPGVIKWSPVQYRYHHWAGLYKQNGRQHYVNRGFGYLAFPGRVGEWPEITVLELTKA